ncbi:MAG: beta-galactosidase [Tepidisphaeraceae bacterium]
MPLSFRLTMAIAAILAGCGTQASRPVSIDTTAAAGSTTRPILSVDLSAPMALPLSGHLKIGGRNPQGVEINANSQYLTKDGKPWTPVMGEFHYVRYPHEQWEDEILKMKSGGVTVVSTYVIWIYHEEIEGQFDWTGDRNLRQFVQLCAKHGLYVYARIGPWCHGEVRNGGLPDWLLKKCKVIRRDDPTFLGYTGAFYAQIRKQLDGLLYKDGGPVIGIQLDNETGNAPRYLLALKKLAVGLGFDVPLYSYTGWNRSKGPPDEMIPFYGGYPDGFWLDEPGVSKGGRRQYVFTRILDDANITEHLTSRPGSLILNPGSRYPYLTCEIGGGMAISYARRPYMTADDIAVLPLVKIGSGANMPGYYMYHGGGNLIGKLGTLQESQATNYPNDLPVINYDYQAPLGQFGQVRDSYHALRLLHTFLADFGSYLAPMQSFLPTTMPSSLSDVQTLRWAVRSDGHRGFIFINNYERGAEMPDHGNVQFTLKLADGAQTVPAAPVNIPSGSYMIWPFNLDLNGTLLKSASAQLLCRLNGPVPSYVFFALPGVDPQFVFESGPVSATGGTLLVRAPDGRQARVLLLTREQALHSWKADIWGAERLLISAANLVFDGPTLRLQTDDPRNLYVSVFPPPPEPPTARGQQLAQSADGLFARYSATISPKAFDVSARQTSPSGLPRPLRMGKRRKPEPPVDADFDAAATWQITVPHNALDGVQNVLLKINYVGDVARAYIGDRLIDDDFYFGQPWEIGLKGFAPEVLEKGITVKILPMPKDARIYIQEDRRPRLQANGQILEFHGADLLSVAPEMIYEISMQ